MPNLLTEDHTALRARCIGPVFTPADRGWHTARQAWNLAVDQRPSAVVYAYDEDDVAAVVDYARVTGLRVAVQGTGHNAAPLGDLSDSVLLRTSELRGVEIDPARRRARVRAGALWQDVALRAGEHGLAALAGSSPDVGVVGYSLGGGIGWLARRHGLQSNSVLAIELVTAEGLLVRVDRDRDPELFWALRGGGGNFGVITAMEFSLYSAPMVHAGALVWDWSESERVLARWAEWAPDAPDAITTSARILQLPELPTVPEPLRGRRVVMIDGAYSGDGDVDAALAPLRELRPEIDMFGPMPPAALVHLHGDPPQPTPGTSRHAMLDVLPREAVSAFVAAAGPGSSLVAAELRQLGGALARTPAGHGALPGLDGAFALFGVGVAMDAASEAAVVASAERLTAAMVPWSNDRLYLNVTETSVDTRRGYRADAYERLCAVRADVDPRGVFQANHPID